MKKASAYHPESELAGAAEPLPLSDEEGRRSGRQKDGVDGTTARHSCGKGTRWGRADRGRMGGAKEKIAWGALMAARGVWRPWPRRAPGKCGPLLRGNQATLKQKFHFSRKLHLKNPFQPTKKNGPAHREPGRVRSWAAEGLVPRGEDALERDDVVQAQGRGLVIDRNAASGRQRRTGRDGNPSCQVSSWRAGGIGHTRRGDASASRVVDRDFDRCRIRSGGVVGGGWTIDAGGTSGLQCWNAVSMSWEVAAKDRGCG